MQRFFDQLKKTFDNYCGKWKASFEANPNWRDLFGSFFIPLIAAAAVPVAIEAVKGGVEAVQKAKKEGKI